VVNLLDGGIELLVGLVDLGLLDVVGLLSSLHSIDVDEVNGLEEERKERRKREESARLSEDEAEGELGRKEKEPTLLRSENKMGRATAQRKEATARAT